MPKRKKTFFKALHDLHNKNIESFFLDKRLTREEKKILKCWLYLKRSKLKELAKLLDSINCSHCDLLSVQKNIIHAFMLNNTGFYLEARNKLKQSIVHLNHPYLKKIEFMAWYNLFQIEQNIHDIQGMKIALDRLESFGQQSPVQTTAIQMCRSSFLLVNEHFDQVNELLLALDQKTEYMPGSMIICHHLTKFDFYCLTSNKEMAFSTIESLRSYRQFKDRSITNYMRALSFHFFEKKPIYIYEKDCETNQFLYFQLKVIQAFEERDLESARIFWQKLQHFNPSIYQDNFSYMGAKNIFSLCLEKYHSVVDYREISQNLALMLERNRIVDASNIETTLYIILRNSPTPIRKEDLYQAIWQEPYLDKSDLSKLKMAISRTRKKYDVEIQYRKGCYQFIEKKKKGA